MQISDNYVATLPETLVKMASLKELNISRNCITVLPNTFQKLLKKTNVIGAHVGERFNKHKFNRKISNS